MKTFITCLLIAGGLCSAFIPEGGDFTLSGLHPDHFNAYINGKPVGLFILRNKKGMEVCISNYGGRIVSIVVPDKKNIPRDVVFGFDHLSDYCDTNCEFGAISSMSSRENIPPGRAEEKTTPPPLNDKQTHDPFEWQNKVFDAEQADKSTLILSYGNQENDSTAGNISARITYRLTADNSLDIQYEGFSNHYTIVHLSHNLYFNLSGNPRKNIGEHRLFINASHYIPLDSSLNPRKTSKPVTNTPMRFSPTQTIGKNLGKTDFEQIKYGNGFNHSWVLNTQGDISRLAVGLSSSDTGITMEFYTTATGVKLYTGNTLDGNIKGKKDIPYLRHTAVCLKSDNCSVFLENESRKEAGWVYYSRNIYTFSVH